MTAPADRPGEAVTVSLAGGLGNQLFQYAAGLAVSRRLDCPLLVDVRRLGAVLPGDTDRQFDLGWLVDSDHIVTGTAAGVPGRLLRRLSRHVPIRSRTFIEASFAYDRRIESVQVGSTLEGYFQSWRYFVSIDDDLRRTLLDRAPRSAWREQVEQDLAAPWTAVHVRRGDYLQPRNAAFHGLLGPDYYAAALGALRESGAEHRIVLFSDEPDAALPLLGEHGVRATVLRPPADVHPMESIALMARASEVVTANSSFSWWGAWLADPKLCTVVSPTPWLSGASADERDLRPPHWLTIDARFGAG